MDALMTFMGGLMSMAWYWQIWLSALMLVNLVLPLVFIGRTEARVVLAAITGAFLAMLVLTEATGFTRLLGLGHILFWVPLLVYLARRLPEVDAASAYGSWMRAVMALNAVSLAIDITDVIRYLGGERSQLAMLF